MYDCLVVGVPDERFGERIVAVASLQPGASADEASIIEGAADHIARYKLPKQRAHRRPCAAGANGKADYPWAREVARSGAAGSPRERRTTLPPPRSADDLDAADRDLDEVGVAVITGVLDPRATADVRASPARRGGSVSTLVGHPDSGLPFDFDEKNRRVFMLFAWDAVFVELIRHPLALRYVKRTIGDFLDLELQRQHHRAGCRGHVPRTPTSTTCRSRGDRRRSP